MTDDAIRFLPVFVYGTLKVGECREPLWPHPPWHRESAVVRGRLYDLGPHPAMVAGEDRIAGELWHLQPQHVAPTLTVLDQIEGYYGSSDDWYVRRIVECFTATRTSQSAYAYLYARPELLSAASIIPPSHDGLCRWSSRPHFTAPIPARSASKGKAR